MWLYQRSHFFRYTEEALAETAAQVGTRDMTGLSFPQAVRQGLKFPLNPNYEISPIRAAAEFSGGLGVFGGSLYGQTY